MKPDESKEIKRIDPRTIKVPPMGESTASLGRDANPAQGAKTGPPTGTQPSAVTSGASPDTPQPLDSRSFPNRPRKDGYPVPATIANVRHLLASYRISARYNVIKKKLSILVPGMAGSPDNADNVALTRVISLATLNGMSTGQIASYVEVVADEHLYNPVADWIDSKPWDGTDRLQALYDTLTERDGFPKALKERLMCRWLISCAAAALSPGGIWARGVLTLQGPQSIGKTAWVRVLVPDKVLQESVIRLDHYLDAHSKDSVLTAISHWIVEIGELDSSFKKDIARLKGFLTNDRDKVRRPYGRLDADYPRRTVFCATVNEPAFLVDATGNTRWWVIPVTRVDYRHGIDMQQVFAQVAEAYRSSEPWWLTADEEQLLETYNRDHRSVSAIRERVLDALDLDRAKEPGLPAMTATELLRKLGIDHPSNPQAKECAAALREALGDPKKIQGQIKWRVPLKEPGPLRTPVRSDDEF
jgi:putative DNA primase/helicase